MAHAPVVLLYGTAYLCCSHRSPVHGPRGGAGLCRRVLRGVGARMSVCWYVGHSVAGVSAGCRVCCTSTGLHCTVVLYIYRLIIRFRERNGMHDRVIVHRNVLRGPGSTGPDISRERHRAMTTRHAVAALRDRLPSTRPPVNDVATCCGQNAHETRLRTCARNLATCPIEAFPGSRLNGRGERRSATTRLR